MNTFQVTGGTCKTRHGNGRGGTRPSRINANRVILNTGGRGATRAEGFCKSLTGSKFQVSSYKLQVTSFKFPFRRTSRSAAGFTILELLVVISIMAVIATLATGAAIKAVKQGRTKKIDATCKALDMALMNYRAQEGKWPFKVTELEQPDRSVEAYWAHGENNKKVFKNMYHGPGSANRTAFLDGSALLTLVDGERAQLRTALGARKTDVPLIYPDPDNTSITRYFCVEYNPVTDKTTVHKQNDHSCPKWFKEK